MLGERCWILNSKGIDEGNFQRRSLRRMERAVEALHKLLSFPPF